jgi:hypothetical protein
MCLEIFYKQKFLLEQILELMNQYNSHLSSADYENGVYHFKFDDIHYRISNIEGHLFEIRKLFQ